MGLKSKKQTEYTVKDLLTYRDFLFLQLMNSHPGISWKSRNGCTDDGSFIAGMNLPSGKISCQIKNNYWKLANVKEVRFVSESDITLNETLNRLIMWHISSNSFNVVKQEL
jgi:hypothetical protein